MENIIIRSEKQSEDTHIQSEFSDVEINKEYQLKAVLRLDQKTDIANIDQQGASKRTDLIFSIVSVEKLKERNEV